MPPPTQGILLAVGADKVTLPVGTEGPHGDGADLGALAAAFGEEAQAFGVVTAVAPASRIVLNEDPTPPDMSADLPYLIAFRMLAASLDDGQWAALTSERGLGLADLTDRTQQTLFHALFRRGRLWVASQDPEMAKLPDDQRTDTRDVSDQIGGVRIRLGQTAGTGIAVYADLSLLPWGDAPPESACDLSIEGETSKEIAVHAHDRAQRADYDDAGKPVVFVPSPVLVSPAAEAVRGSLTTLVQGLSARPGLAGFIWEDAEAGDGLGYTPAMRLAFLRFAHSDPLDITPQLSLKGDVSLPLFEDAAADKSLPVLWDKARAGANAALLGGMRQALTPPMSARPILMEQSTDSATWLASWDDPRQLPPPLRPLFAGVPYPKPEQTATVAAKQGRIVLLRAQVQNSADTDALARALQADLGGKMAGGRSAWGGFVLDFADEEATRGDHPLAGLVDTAAREAKAR